MRYIGIDVGLSGAIGVLDLTPQSPQARRVEVFDMPVTWTRNTTGKNRREYDLPALWRIFSRLGVLDDGSVYAVIEQQQAFSPPGRNIGATSVFSLGYGLGVCKAMLVAASIPFEAVSPVKWKRAFGLTGSGKGKSRQLAAQLFPEIDFGRRKDEGRSEGMLLAEYAVRQKRGGA